MVEKVEKIWMDGELVNWDAANVHVLTHTLHYGLGVFEGIRCYKLDDGGSAIFRLRDHVRRLFESAHIMTMPIERWSPEDVENACLETVRANGLSACYVRPLAFMGDGAMGLAASDNPTRLSVVAWNWGTYLGEEGLKNGIRAKVSSYQRSGVNMTMAKGKVCGHYVNSILAKREALNAGYEEAILLDAQGYVCEASGENIFLVRDGKVHTPPYGSSILGGITRNTTEAILKELGLSLTERTITRDELYIADEMFLVGTAAEVTPVRALDDRTIGSGSRGPITKRIQDRYFQMVRGVEVPDASWLSRV